MAKSDLGGVWRTVGGRRIFIKDGQSLDDAMRESGKFNNNLTKEDEEIIYNYTKGYQNDLNIDLRNGKKVESETIKELDRILAKGKIKKGETLYRTAHINELGLNIDEEKMWKNLREKLSDNEYGSKDFYKREYETYTEQNKENYKSWKDKIKVGQEIEDKAFKSTSTNEEIVKSYHNLYMGESYGNIPSPTQVLIKYSVTKDINGINISQKSYIKNQNEVLLQRNTKSKIKSIKFNEKYKLMEIEMDLYK